MPQRNGRNPDHALHTLLVSQTSKPQVTYLPRYQIGSFTPGWALSVMAPVFYGHTCCHMHRYWQGIYEFSKTSMAVVDYLLEAFLLSFQSGPVSGLQRVGSVAQRRHCQCWDCDIRGNMNTNKFLLLLAGTKEATAHYLSTYLPQRDRGLTNEWVGAGGISGSIGCALDGERNNTIDMQPAPLHEPNSSLQGPLACREQYTRRKGKDKQTSPKLEMAHNELTAPPWTHSHP